MGSETNGKPRPSGAGLDVLYVGTLPPHPGGSALSGVQLVGALARHGVRMRAVGPVVDPRDAPTLAAEYPDVEFHRYPTTRYEINPDRSHGGDIRALENEALHSLLPGLIRSDPPDVILLGRETYAWHLPEPAISGSIPCVLRAAGGGVNGLVRGLTPPGFEDRLRRTSMQIVPGRHMVETLQDFGCDRVRHIENPVDMQRFAPEPRDPSLLRELDIDPSHLVVSHVSNLKPLKRPQDFLDAAAAVLEALSGVTFLIVGDGPLRSDMESRCRELRIAEHVRFTGWRDYGSIPALIRLSDMVVMCSEREGLARVYLETMACERVLISSDIPPAREVVDPGRTGLLFPLGDPRALAARILEAARSDGLREQLGRAARDAIRHHDLDDVGARYVQILRAAANLPDAATVSREA